MAAKIEIVVGVNNTQANAALKKTQQELVSTGKAVQGLDQKLAGGLVKGSNSATLALTNLGRVAQDAPFGFIGIQNNLNPLLESFQRLRAESGSTGAALKALGGSLLGGAGIGLAISVVTGLLTVLSQQGFFKASQAADESAESFKRLGEVISETSKTISERNAIASAGVEDEITKVNSLAAVIKNQNLSYEQRNNALLQLQKINKNYFGDIALEGEGLQKLTSRVNEYTDALIASAVVKSFSQDIGKLSVEFALQLNTLNKLNKELDKNRQILAGTKESTTSLTGEDRLSAEFVAAEKAANKSTEAVKKQSEVIVDLSGRLRELKTGFQRAIEESLKFKPLDEEKGETVKKVKAITEELGKLKKVLLEIDQIRFFEKGRFDEFLKNVKPDSKVFNKVTIPIKPEISLPDLEKSIEKIEVDITPLMEQMGTNIGTSLGESIGNAISGSGGFENAFQGIIMVLASGLKEVGKLLIQTGVKMAIAKAALDKIRINPYLAIAAGIALVALGTAAQNSFNKKKGFARGGLVPGVGNTDSVDAAIMPGEFVLRKSAVQAIGPTSLSLMNAGVMPAGNISAGSQRVEIVGEGSISGETIYIAYKRYEQRRGRTT